MIEFKTPYTFDKVVRLLIGLTIIVLIFLLFKRLSAVLTPFFIGWLIAYVMGKEKMDSLLRYHLKQSLGLGLVSLAFSISLNIVASIVPALSFLGIIGYAIIVLWVIGIINAANREMKPIPFIGKAFEDKFSFIG